MIDSYFHPKKISVIIVNHSKIETPPRRVRGGVCAWLSGGAHERVHVRLIGRGVDRGLHARALLGQEDDAVVHDVHGPRFSQVERDGRFLDLLSPGAPVHLEHLGVGVVEVVPFDFPDRVTGADEVFDQGPALQVQIVQPINSDVPGDASHGVLPSMWCCGQAAGLTIMYCFTLSGGAKLVGLTSDRHLVRMTMWSSMS